MILLPLSTGPAFDNTLKDELDKLTTYETNLEMKILDTAVTLSSLRDNIKNLRFTVEEAADNPSAIQI